MTDHDKRIARLTFAAVYPHYLAKVEKKDAHGKSYTK